MSFDKFLLPVESRDLSQADKSIIFQSSVWVSELHFLPLNNKASNFCKMNVLNLL